MTMHPAGFARGPRCPDDVSVWHNKHTAWLRLPDRSVLLVFDVVSDDSYLAVREMFLSPDVGWLVYNDSTPNPADVLAAAIRRVDGNHSLGASALAEALLSELPAFVPLPPSPEAVEEKVKPEAGWVGTNEATGAKKTAVYVHGGRFAYISAGSLWTAPLSTFTWEPSPSESPTVQEREEAPQPIAWEVRDWNGYVTKVTTTELEANEHAAMHGGTVHAVMPAGWVPNKGDQG